LAVVEKEVSILSVIFVDEVARVARVDVLAVGSLTIWRCGMFV
jgi:hypothetical protein